MALHPRPKTDEYVGTKTEDESIVCKDKWNYVLLVFLYVLQGIFGGLLHAIPLILQENGISYKEQAVLNTSWLTMWSKLLMAPVIECIYNSRIGKRKSWLIPGQYLLGSMMLLSSFYIDTWVGENNHEPNILPITITIFFSHFLLSILDMVLDSWALTMLRRENIGYQATCNIIGFKIGIFLGTDIFILLRSEEISLLLGHKSSILSFSGCFYFWSIILLVCNTFVWIFKKDNSLDVMDKNDKQLSIVNSYKLIWEVLKLKSVRRFCIILLLNKTVVASLMSLTSLKLIRRGITSDKLVLMGIPFIPLQSMLPFIFRKYFRSKRSLVKYARAIIYMYKTLISSAVWKKILDLRPIAEYVLLFPIMVHRIPIGFLFSQLFFFMPDMELNNGPLITTAFYLTYFIIQGVEMMVSFLIQTNFMSFLAKITDLKYAAVYLTVINTVGMGGFIWPSQLAKLLVDPLTFVVNVGDNELCVDGYYIIFLIGTAWNICFFYFGGLNAIRKLQELDEKEWKIHTEEKYGLKRQNVGERL